MPRVLAALLTSTVMALGAVGCAPVHVPDRAATQTNTREVPYLVLRLAERRLYLHGDEKAPPESFLVAIGKQPWETPTGRFQVIEMIENPEFMRFDWNAPSHVHGTIPPGPDNPLGLRWIGFTHAHGWTIGLHGTQKTELLGQAVSHGCVRMRNSDIVKLFDRVKIGTPVIVEP